MLAPRIVILYEDTDILVIDKPAGMTVNRAETTRHEVTVQDWAEEKIGITYDVSSIEYNYNEEGWNPEQDFFKRGGIVHRLDKETSGVLVLAKNPATFVALQKKFKERTVTKSYLALTHGKLLPKSGEISVPVGRLPWNRIRFCIVLGVRESKTFYSVVDYFRMSNEVVSLVEFFPQSGRTHQIRVHLKYLGHPIVSDELYGGRKAAR